MPVDKEKFLEELDGDAQKLRGLTLKVEEAKKILLPHNHWATCPNANDFRRRG